MGNKNLHVKTVVKFTSEKLIGSHPGHPKKKKKATSQVLTVINYIHIQFVLLRDRPLFLTNSGHNYHLLFLGEKVSSGIWETGPKILGGYEYQNPPPPNGG